MMEYLNDNKTRNKIGVEMFVTMVKNSPNPTEKKIMDYLSCYEETPAYLRGYLLKTIQRKDNEVWDKLTEVLTRIITIDSMEKIVKDYEYKQDNPDEGSLSDPIKEIDAMLELLKRTK